MSKVTGTVGNLRFSGEQEDTRKDYYIHEIPGMSRVKVLVIPHKSPRLRESNLLDECALQILRCAQDDILPGCHPIHCLARRARSFAALRMTNSNVHADCPARTSNSGRIFRPAIREATLPVKRASRPVRPWLASTIRSTFKRSARPSTSGTISPRRTSA